MAPPEHTNHSGTASVLPPVPTISSSSVHVSHEPAHRVVDDERTDEDEDGDETEKKGKGTDGDELGEDGDEGDGKDWGEDGDQWEDGDQEEDKVWKRDEDQDEEEDTPVVCFGPPKVALASSVNGKIFLFVVFYLI